MFDQFADVQKLTAKNIDATVKVLGVLAGNSEAVAKELTSFTTGSLQRRANVYATLLDVRSFDAALEVQSQYVRTNFDEYTNQLVKLTELYGRFAKQVLSLSKETAAAPKESAAAPLPPVVQAPVAEMPRPDIGAAETELKDEPVPAAAPKPGASASATKIKPRQESGELRAS